jgi:glutathione S-transferase
LDKQLENKRYFCGEDVSIADIQYFCEISTIANLTKKDLNQSDYPNLAVWYNERLSQIPEIDSVDRKLKEIINKYNFHV